MQRMTLHEFEEQAQRFDSTVLCTADIDHFCSSTLWTLPAHNTLMQPQQAWILAGEHGYVTLARGQHTQGWHYLQPLEAAWCLSSPLLGDVPHKLVEDFASFCRAYAYAWDVMILAGLKIDSILYRALFSKLAARYPTRQGPVARRYVASLKGGTEGFLSRRSANFRRGLAKDIGRIAQDGIVFEYAHCWDVLQADAAYERILAVEARSWKGKKGVGINMGSMCEFYRLINRRLVERGAQRMIIARHEDRDIGYVFGGIFGDTYRGLQFSFDDDYSRYGLGNVLQYEQIIELCKAGIQNYDLGTDVAYKRRWGEICFDTVMLVVHR
ncbi:MAG: GNAT family N-acetyltransferase [Myxococcota bacterium]